MTRGAALVAVVVLAGCGGTTQPPRAAKPPRIPRALATSWETRANAVARALAAGDGCTALQQATALRDAVAQSQTRIPVRLRATLFAVVQQLPARITCNPPAVRTAPVHPHPHPHPPPPHPHPPHDHGGPHGPGHGGPGHHG